MENQTKTFCLFNRHELPENLGAICNDFNFETFAAEKSPLWEQAANTENCEIIVTGLTPALTEFISEWAKRNIYVGQIEYGGETLPHIENNKLVLLHYNNKTNSYVRQAIFQ